MKITWAKIILKYFKCIPKTSLQHLYVRNANMKCICEMFEWNHLEILAVSRQKLWTGATLMLRFIFAKFFTSLALRSTADVHNLVFLDTPCANEDRIGDEQHCCIQKCFPFGTVIKLMIDAPDHLPNSCNRNINKRHKCKKHNNFKTTIVFQMHSTILAIYFDFRVWDRSKEKALRVLVYYSWWWRTVSIDKM